jgi:protease-4
MTITGSIGVIMHSYNYRGLMDKIGLQPNVYKSGAHKDMLSGEREPGEIPADERAMVQALIDETYGRFKFVVDEGRTKAHEQNQKNIDGKGKALAADWKDYADGRVLSGRRAEELGFVDEVGNFDIAIKRAKAIAGDLKKANLVKYKVRNEFADLFRLFGKTEVPAIKVDLGLSGLKLEAGQFYFLSPLALH